MTNQNAKIQSRLEKWLLTRELPQYTYFEK